MKNNFFILKNQIQQNKKKKYHLSIVIESNTNKTIRIKGEVYTPMAGTVFFLASSVPFEIDDGITYYITHLGEKCREKFINLLYDFERVDMHFQDDVSLSTSINFLLDSYNRERCCTFQLCYDELKLLKLTFDKLIEQQKGNNTLLDLMNSFETCILLHGFLIKRLSFLEVEGEKENYVTVEKVKKYIRENLDRQIYLEELSKKFAMNSKDLNFMFRIYEKKTIREYIISEKIEVASELLFQDEIGIDEIIPKIGIKDPAYFYRIFKKKTGFTPNQYKKTKILSVGTV